MAYIGTVEARFWPSVSGRSPDSLISGSLFVRQRELESLHPKPTRPRARNTSFSVALICTTSHQIPANVSANQGTETSYLIPRDLLVAHDREGVVLVVVEPGVGFDLIEI